jgi:hypothetical protein
MVEPSTTATGSPVSIELRMIAADARATPADTLPGKDAIHFTPAIRCSPPTWAGSAMILLRFSCGNLRKTECGTEVSPRACAR